MKKTDHIMGPKYIMTVHLQLGTLSDKCIDCQFCHTNGYNKDQKICMLHHHVVNPELHDYRCPAQFTAIELEEE